MTDNGKGLGEFLGCAMVAVGLLITTLSGGCTLLVVVSAFQSNSFSFSLIQKLLVFAGPFIAVGIALVFGGVAVFRPSLPSPSKQSPITHKNEDDPPA